MGFAEQLERAGQLRCRLFPPEQRCPLGPACQCPRPPHLSNVQHASLPSTLGRARRVRSVGAWAAGLELAWSRPDHWHQESSTQKTGNDRQRPGGRPAGGRGRGLGFTLHSSGTAGQRRWLLRADAPPDLRQPSAPSWIGSFVPQPGASAEIVILKDGGVSLLSLPSFAAYSPVWARADPCAGDGPIASDPELYGSNI